MSAFNCNWFYIVLLIAPQSIYCISCYSCGGFDCFLNGSQTVDCPTGLCMMMTVDVSQTVRDCAYPDSSDFIQCKNRIHSGCRLCKGNLCNNWPLLNEKNVISCLSCARGRCKPGSPNSSFRRCSLFRNPELPRCFTIVDRLLNDYTFGCANEMTKEQWEMCEYDYFQSVCRFCDTPNCNTKFFAGRTPNELKCYSTIHGTGMVIKYCSKNNMFPYFGCFTTGFKSKKITGCLSDFYTSPKDERYMKLFTDSDMANSMVVCFKDHCNKDWHDSQSGCKLLFYAKCDTISVILQMDLPYATAYTVALCPDPLGYVPKQRA